MTSKTKSEGLSGRGAPVDTLSRISSALGVKRSVVRAMVDIYSRFGSSWFTVHDYSGYVKQVPKKVYVSLNYYVKLGLLKYKYVFLDGRPRKMYRLSEKTVEVLKDALGIGSD